MAKVVRTDRELELPGVDAGLRTAGHELVLLPDGIAEARLTEEASDAQLILMCYTPITRRVIEGARRLKGIVKYGVGIDAVDIAAAQERGIPVVNVPEYAEETVAEGAFALMMALAKNLKKLEKAMSTEGWVWPEAPLAGVRARGQDGRRGRSRPHRHELRAHGDGLSHARAFLRSVRRQGDAP